MKRTYDYESIVKELKHVVKDEKVYRQIDYGREQLAERLGVPNYVISKVMKEQLNTSLLDYLNKYRVKYAHTILTAPRVKRHTIEEIAYMSGFSCRMTFYRAYWKFFGFAPGYERKSKKAEQEAED